MEDLDNVKLISLFQSLGAEISSVPIVSHCTVRLNTDVRGHLQGRAVRVMLHAWKKSLSIALWGWKVQTHSPSLTGAPSSTHRRRLRPIRKPVYRPEHLETSSTFPLTLNPTGTLHLRSASMHTCFRIFRSCLRLLFYRWKLTSPSISSDKPIRIMTKLLSNLRKKRLKDALKSLSNSSLSFLNKSFELPPSAKISFHLGDSLDMELEEPHFLPIQPNRKAALRILVQKLELRWYFSLKLYLIKMKNRLKNAPKGTLRVKKAIKLQALVRGFLTRLRFRYKTRLLALFESREMWLLALFLRRNIRHFVGKMCGNEADIRSRVAYALRFKRLMTRARRPVVSVGS